MSGALDLGALVALHEAGGIDLVHGMSELFRLNAPDRIEQIVAALGRDDLEAVRRHAHFLKGTASHVGAGGLEDLARTLEQQAHSGARDELRALGVDLAREYARAQAELAEEVRALEALTDRSSPPLGRA